MIPVGYGTPWTMLSESALLIDAEKITQMTALHLAENGGMVEPLDRTAMICREKP